MSNNFKSHKLFNYNKERNIQMKSNDTLIDHIDESDIEQMKLDLETQFGEVLHTLQIDYENDPNSKGTPKRLAKMYVEELMVGRYRKSEKLGTLFPNQMDLDQVYAVGPIEVKSMCSHHWMPIVGEAYIGIKATHNVLGLSKFHRRLHELARRPQIQEEFTQQVLKDLVDLLEPDGAIVVISAKHLCGSHRGVNSPQSSTMATSALSGCFRSDKSLKNEFFELINLMKTPNL